MLTSEDMELHTHRAYTQQIGGLPELREYVTAARRFGAKIFGPSRSIYSVRDSSKTSLCLVQTRRRRNDGKCIVCAVVMCFAVTFAG